MIKTGAKILFLVLVISASFYVAIVKYRAAKGLLAPKQWNVLVLSFCSLRDDVLRAGLTPNIEKFFAPGAYRLDNGVNPNPWTTVFHYQSKRWFRSRVNEAGYEVIGFDSKGYTRIPPRRGQVGEEKNYAEALARFRGEILQPRDRPFMAVAHFTYMHYPYIDRAHGWDRFLSAGEKARLESYMNRPEQFPGKLPLLLVLTGDLNYLAKNKKTAAAYSRDPDRARLMGMVANRELLDDWRKSAGFAADREILRKIYEAQAVHMDEFIADALNLWGDEKLRENTVVILTGDHGEMLMEHGELSHATALYESAVRFPFLMRFPGQTGGIERRSEQIQLDSVAFMLEELMSGRLQREGMDAFWKQRHQPVTLLRDCANKLRGLRENGKAKYIVRLADDEKFLFDLKTDPKETRNLAAKDPGQAVRLEELYWSKYENFARMPSRNCAPAALGE